MSFASPNVVNPTEKDHVEFGKYCACMSVPMRKPKMESTLDHPNQ